MRMGSIVLQIWLRSQEASRAQALVGTLGRAALYRQLPSNQMQQQQSHRRAPKRYSRTKYSSSAISCSRTTINSRSSKDTWGSILRDKRRYGSYSWWPASLGVEEQLHWLKGDTSSLETLSESERNCSGRSYSRAAEWSIQIQRSWTSVYRWDRWSWRTCSGTSRSRASEW